MSIQTPVNWWKPLLKEEKIWVYIILVWVVIMLVMMPLGHLVSNQNVSQESYRTTPEKFSKVENEFIKYQQRKDKDGKPVDIAGIPVVEAPEGKDSFLVARAWRFEPVLVLKKNKTYRIHMSSLDYQHGFSLQPQNLNFQIMPDYDFVITLTPNEAGTFHIVCNEYCFYASNSLGHDTMVGQIIVEN